MSTTVVLAEDSYLVREGVRALLEHEDDIDLVAVCDDLEGLLAAVEEHRPDVVLTDIRMPPTGTTEGIDAASRLRTTHPATGVVVLSQYLDAAYALALFEQGSERRGYLLKETLGDAGQLVHAIREVAGGGSVVDPKVVDALVAARTERHGSALAQLTPRELEVLGEVARGKSNAAVAASLFVTERAVEKHINAIFSKLGLTEDPESHRRVRAVLVYLAESGTG